MSLLERTGPGRLRVLVVDDEADVRLGLRLLIQSLRAEVREAANGETALQTLSQWTPHLMVTDLSMGAVSGMELLRQVRERRPEVKVLMITGFGTIQLAVEAMRLGASHFITKPFDNPQLLAEVERLGRAALAAEEGRRMKAVSGLGGAGMVAESLRMVEILELVRQVAPTSMPVLIRGESGTGKELIARTLHEHSREPLLPFLPVNSAALPDTLLESELFGHVKGAFTGADSHREGLFVKARGGTVFLDEIALMSAAFQGKLLRVLQDHTVTPLGSSTPKPAAFRLVAATNRSLRAMVARGAFREDLYYRLKVVTIDVPPLRERLDEVVPLALHFLAAHAGEAGYAPERRPGLSAGAIELLQRHTWPGNVRELENSIRRALVLCRGEDIEAQHLGLDEGSGEWRPEAPVDLSYQAGKQKALDDHRRRAVERALRATGGNVTQAAEMCDLSRAAFQRIMRSLGLDRRQFTGNP
ncbi:MAG TPA: sigma-54 dependent transcriptional regulator [Thermoanaerobaculia bacterium]